MSGYWLRLKTFYHRYGIVFWCFGLLGGTHIFWWQIQQNRVFVSPDRRVRKLGPFEIPYLDEKKEVKK